MMNKKTSYKYGFTLVELLCAIAILAVCITMALVNIKPAQKAAHKYFYSNALMTIQKAFYNAMINEFNPFIDIVDKETGVVTPLKHSAANDTGTQRLCEGLTAFINTSSTSCSATNLANELATNVSLSATADEAAVSARQGLAQFTTANGMQYFISGLIDRNLNGDPNKRLRFYLVYVDINGDKGPNSIVYTEKTKSNGTKTNIEPDVFAFALLENGLTCPLGIPEYDTNIMTARVSYFDSESRVVQTRQSLPYYQAKAKAWGFYSSSVNVLNNFTPDVPFTMNDAIRAVLNTSSLIVKDFPDFSTLTPSPEDSEEDSDALAPPMPVASDSPTNCSTEDVESCDVIIDEYRH